MRSVPVLMVKPLSSPVLLVWSPTKPLKLTFTPEEEGARGRTSMIFASKSRASSLTYGKPFSEVADVPGWEDFAMPELDGR